LNFSSSDFCSSEKKHLLAQCFKVRGCVDRNKANILYKLEETALKNTELKT